MNTIRNRKKQLKPAMMLVWTVVIGLGYGMITSAAAQSKGSPPQEHPELTDGVQTGLDAATEYHKAVAAKAKADDEAIKKMKKDPGKNNVVDMVCKLGGLDSYGGFFSGSNVVSQMVSNIKARLEKEEGRHDYPECNSLLSASGQMKCEAEVEACKSIVSVPSTPSAFSMDQQGHKHQTWYAMVNIGQSHACKVNLEWHFERESVDTYRLKPWGGKKPHNVYCSYTKPGYCVASFYDKRDIQCTEAKR